MKFLLSAFVLAGLLPVARAADEENPFKKSKVGDWVEYKMSIAAGGFNSDGTIKMVVTAKDDKKVTLETTGKFGGMDVPSTKSDIDLTKPYDPLSTANIPKGTEAKVDKVAEGKEKVKVGAKEYDCTWTDLKVTTKVADMTIEAKAKIWMSKEVPLSGMVKMEMSSKFGNQEGKMTMELSETGSK